jgi:hypothetical protein
MHDRGSVRRTNLGCPATPRASTTSAHPQRLAATMLALLLGFITTAAARAADPAAPDVSAPPSLSQFFREMKPKVDLRTRYEFADQKGRGDASSITGRIRLGLQTPQYRGFQAYVELEHTEAADRDRYDAAPGNHGKSLGPTDKAVIADPESNELNQAWLSYDSPVGLFKVGRQRIMLDEARFIGNVGWRQNEQTYDGAVLEAKPLKNLDLFYGYVLNVNRIFGSHGDDSRLVSPTHDFDSRSHLAQATYRAHELATVRTYAFLLDLERDRRLDRGSSDTYGLNVTGAKKWGDMGFSYRAEYALQSDAADAPASYHARYYHLKAAGSWKSFTLGAAREALGEDNGVGFATPLATQHAYNGYADLFLTTPADGLVDDYAFFNFPLPAKVQGELAFHTYHAASGGNDYGREINLVIKRALPHNMLALMKVASYRARDAAPNVALRDTLRFTAQIEFRWN